MSEELVAKWNVAQEKVKVAQQAIDEFQVLIKTLRDLSTQQFEALKMPVYPKPRRRRLT